MSVAGLKKQFYKASQVSGGRGGARWGWCAAPGSDCSERGQEMPGLALTREGTGGSEGRSWHASLAGWVQPRRDRVCVLGRPGSVRHVGSSLLEEGGQTVERSRNAPRGCSRTWISRLLSFPLKDQGGSGEREEEEGCRHREPRGREFCV